MIDKQMRSLDYNDAVSFISHSLSKVNTRDQFNTACFDCTMILEHVNENDMTKVIDFLSVTQERVENTVL